MPGLNRERESKSGDSSGGRPRGTAMKALRSAGHRLTQQRSLLLQLIEEADGHLDADEIHRLARERDSRINLSTVYRTLALLKDLDLVTELHFDENHHHYESKSEREHYHLICSKCGKVIEFHSRVGESLHNVLARRHDFEITSTRIEVGGYCGDCRRRQSPQRVASYGDLSEGLSANLGVGRQREVGSEG